MVTSVQAQDLYKADTLAQFGLTANGPEFNIKNKNVMEIPDCLILMNWMIFLL